MNADLPLIVSLWVHSHNTYRGRFDVGQFVVHDGQHLFPFWIGYFAYEYFCVTKYCRTAKKAKIYKYTGVWEQYWWVCQIRQQMAFDQLNICGNFRLSILNIFERRTHLCFPSWSKQSLLCFLCVALVNLMTFIFEFDKSKCSALNLCSR